MRVVAVSLLLSSTALTGVSTGAHAATVDHARVDKSVLSYVVNRDLTYTEVAEQDETVLDARGIRTHSRASRTFNPENQAVSVEEAWVTRPDGTRLDVTPANIFTRPSGESQSAPGFSSTYTTTVVWPQLNENSRTHIKWRMLQKEPPLLGFNVVSSVSPDIAVTSDFTEVTAPADLPLFWGERGGYTTADTVTDGVRHITALKTDTPASEPENNAISDADTEPVFAVTSLPNLEAVGAIYYREGQDKAAVTPEIAALAHRIAGNKTGRDAVQAVNDWVATRIRYVAIYLDPNAGWVPHPASEVLHAGYGDCKDHVVIMQALLAALGIDAQAAIVNWGTRWAPLPVWSPWQFNHAIIYVPSLDMFLNPTNPFAPLDAQDRTLAGKTVVVATPEGRVLRTPESRPDDYRSRIEADVRVAPDGTIEGNSTVALAPSLEANPRSAVANASSPRELADQLLMGTPEGGVGTVSSSDPKNLAVPFRLQAEWRSPHGVVLHGDNSAMTVPYGIDFGPVSRLRSVLSPDKPRERSVLVGARDYGWTTTVHLPPGLRASALPAPVRVANEAGAYTADYQRTADGVRVTRRLVIGKDVYAPTEAKALEDVIYAPLDDARTVLPLSPAEAG